MRNVYDEQKVGDIVDERVENQEHIIRRTLPTDACQTRFGPPPRASSVACRMLSEISQCSGLCCCHTFLYASNILELPLIRTNVALSSRLHRRTSSTWLGREYHFPTIKIFGEDQDVEATEIGTRGRW